MDKVFLRNFLLFVLLLTVCVSTLLYHFISSDRELGRVDEKVFQTHEIIAEAEKLSGRLRAMLASQRGYLLTGDKNFLEAYALKKSEVSENIVNLMDLTAENPSQQSRLEEIKEYYKNFSSKLEDRANQTDTSITDTQTLEDVEEINRLKDTITRINSAVLDEEYKLLNQRIYRLETKKSQYLVTLIGGVIIGTLLLILLNAFLLRAQQKRTRAEASLKDSEDRFALALEGTQDGIFDWDIKNNTVYYSQRFFEMLGYKDKPKMGTKEDFSDLLHPEDAPELWQHVDQYLAGEMSEFSKDFRMKHESGRWVWIQSRARALFKDGEAYRMVGAHTDITHVRKAQERLEAEKDLAEAANKAKSEFLAHMSHEIRTPLTAISGIAEILAKQQEGFTDKQVKLISTLNNSTTSLKDLIRDVLDFSKIESGQLELEKDSFSLGVLFEQVVSMMSLKANEKGVSFILDYAVLKNVDFYGDSVRLRQILINLISNAIKFTDVGGSVSVQAYFEDREDDEYLRVDVSDTGIGISPDNFDLVFERFKQADSSVSRRFGGTGLGLAISRNLSRLMGGDIFLSSEVGKGSTFSLLIPKATGSSVYKEESTKRNKKLTEKIQSAINDETKALIVEDYEGNVVVIGFILDELGIEYDVAPNGAEAVKLWKEHYYDVILMDVQMPEMDGFAATKKIRELEKSESKEFTPIIGMTAHALVGDKDKCIEAGMNSYLPKPIVERDLKREILRFVEASKKIKEVA